jgi:hypothetical protein
MALYPSIAVFDLILGYDIACRWQGSILNSQLFYTPQLLCVSTTVLEGWLVYRGLSVAYNSLSG